MQFSSLSNSNELFWGQRHSTITASAGRTTTEEQEQRAEEQVSQTGDEFILYNRFLLNIMTLDDN
jgi:hypothetical protein